MKKVLILAAGTGGHIFPALAIAKALQQQSVEVAWIGTPQGLESKLLASESIPLYKISVQGLRGKGIKRCLFGSLQMIRAFFQSLGIIYRFKPNVVLAMGGFVCGPSGVAVWALRKKLILHEQNSVAGLTNKMLAPFAQKILMGFPKTKGFSSTKCCYVGNPIRAEIEAISEPEDRFQFHAGAIRLLIFGGSQGATSFNQEIPKVIAQLPQALRPEIWHQSGGQYYDQTVQAYQQAQVEAKITPFIEDMVEAYTWADLVICRSGASSVAELSAIGLAAILIPYPYHKDEQQKYNAGFLVGQGAAVLLTHQALLEGKLTPVLHDLLSSREKLVSMAKAGRMLRKEHVAEQIVSELRIEGESD